jgi:4-alpha-glucanotransferase
METKTRQSGILVHITSLPGKFGIGTLGEEAYRFVDFLEETKQSYWQILPLGHTGYGDAPYSCYSAFAGNPLLIDLDSLPFYDHSFQPYSVQKVDFERVKKEKFPILYHTAQQFLQSNNDKSAFERFNADNAFWLDDYCLFMTIKNNTNDSPLWVFEKDLKFRNKNVLDQFRKEHSDAIEMLKAIQFFFFEQWFKLKHYANSKGIQIIGDVPLYVAGDSADVWANPEVFMLNEEMTPIKVAGVPPDYFSATGQLWGNPVFDWESNKKTGYRWWKERISMNLNLFDIVRIDHFRGFSEFWAVPFGNETAEHGEWLPGPDDAFLDEIFEKREKFIAEDLGVPSPGIIRLLKRYQLPGMKVLQFAFDSGADNPFLPHNYTENCIVYTGTHDNDTSMGMYDTYNEEEKKFLHDYYCFEKQSFAHHLMRFAWASVAYIAIAPLQDLLQLGKEHRMNTPGTIGGNWEWKYEAEDIKQEHKDFLKKITQIYGRTSIVKE